MLASISRTNSPSTPQATSIQAPAERADTTAEAAHIRDYRSLGVTYFYTHVTRILRMGTAEFFKVTRDKA